MDDVDKIVAAIFAASMCSGKNCDHATYLQTYDDFIDKMKSREKAKHKGTPAFSKELRGRLAQGKKPNT